MCWEKNIDGNLRVIKYLKEEGHQVQYDMFGDGSDREQALFLVDKYGLNDVVTIHGRVPNETISKQLHEYDFYLQLSHSESLGMSVIEAQAHGIPAVVSNAGGLPEIVEHNKTGCVVDSFEIEEAANYIIQLSKSNEDYLKISEAAIQKAQSSFNIELEMERLMTLYKLLK
jgi:glycosyltransferase involved in cell wall biosynthesis